MNLWGGTPGVNILPAMLGCYGRRTQSGKIQKPGFVKKYIRKVRRLEDTKRRRRERHEAKAELKESIRCPR